MAAKQRSRKSAAAFRWEYGKLIPRAVIRDYARQIAERFRPEKIILFGSYAYGKPHKDSDVDILVVMPAYNEINQAVRILEKTDPDFPADLIVRTPKNLRWRLEEGDWFLREVIGKGKVLYEKADGGLDSQGRKRSSSRKKRGKAPTAGMPSRRIFIRSFLTNTRLVV
ncbi:MAG: nucleotidyltransferase domain-containing protein [Gemmataceae bacterium]|nr:nucleotidyltransferase domain-containing protein [Gemmataceae bacterium]